MCFYRILGVATDSSKVAIRGAYLKKAKELHPDMNPHPEAVHKFKEVQEAYAVLSSDDQRREYNAQKGIASRGSRAPTRGPLYNTTRDDFYGEFYKQSERMRREAHDATFEKRRRAMEGAFGDAQIGSNFFSVFLRILPLFLFPSVLLLLILKNAQRGGREPVAPPVVFDSFGRAYMVDAYGRKYRMASYDQF